MALDFEFTSEQKMVEETVWRWVSSWLEPQMEELYEQDRMPPDLFRELGKIGVNGIVFEEKYGGRASAMWRPCWSMKPSPG